MALLGIGPEIVVGPVYSWCSCQPGRGCLSPRRKFRMTLIVNTCAYTRGFAVIVISSLRNG